MDSVEKMKKLQDRVREAIPDRHDNMDVEYWREEGEEGTEFHGIDLVWTGSAIELYFEEVERPYKDFDDAIEYISGVLYWDVETLSEIQDDLPHRHRSVRENVNDGEEITCDC